MPLLKKTQKCHLKKTQKTQKMLLLKKTQKMLFKKTQNYRKYFTKIALIKKLMKIFFLVQRFKRISRNIIYAK